MPQIPSWPGASRPSTPYHVSKKVVDARTSPGMTTLHIPPDSNPLGSRLIFRGEQFRGRVRGGAGAAVAQDDLGQILSVHIAAGAIGGRRVDAYYLAAAEKTRQRAQRTAVVVGDDAFQLEQSAADRKRRGVDDIRDPARARIGDLLADRSRRTLRRRHIGISPPHLRGRL